MSFERTDVPSGEPAAAETPAAPEATVEGAAPAAEAPQPETETKPEQKKRDYKQERIDRQTRENYELKRKLAELEAALPKTESSPAAEAPTFDEAEIDRRAEAKLEQRRFAEGTTRVASQGRAQFPDFDKAIENLSANFGADVPKDFYDAIIELPNGHEVFRDVALDDDLSHELMAMTPIKRAMKLQELSGKPKPQPAAAQLSRAPAPITPIRPGATPTRTVYDDKLATADWIAEREAQIAAKKGAR